MSKQWRAMFTTIRSKRVEIILFLLFVVNYSYTFPRWADPNQNSRLNMVIAVVEDGTFRIDPYVANTVDYAKVGDHYYSDKAPGAAFLGIPIYAVVKIFLDLPAVNSIMALLSDNAAFRATLRAEGTGIQEQKIRFAIAQVVLSFFLAAIPTALIGILLYWLLGKFSSSPLLRACVVIAYGLLTPVLAYGGAFYGHQLSTMFVFIAFYFAWQHAHQYSTVRAILSGIFLALSIVTEYPVFLLAILVYLYLAFRLQENQALKKIFWVTASGLVIGAGWMLYNNTVFGGPLELGYQYSELWVDQHATGFFSLTSPQWDAIWGITFSEFRGLFFLSPLLLLSIPGFFLWWRSKQYRLELIVCLVAISVIFLFNASSVMWWGGFAIGPRYLLPALPFMALALIPVVEKAKKSKLLIGVIGLLSLWSFAMVWCITLAGQAFPPDTIRNPLFEYAFPAWKVGDIARNLGTVMGLGGLWSLFPLAIISVILIFLIMASSQPEGLKTSTKKNNRIINE